MCRIVGLVNAALPEEEVAQLVGKMNNRLIHGGPDAQQLQHFPGCHFSLGHCRLAIIGIAPSGNQPMQYAPTADVIAYNGELYNYRELKVELQQQGCVFTTDTDTEVVLAAYATWGTDAFARFTGMFAFALWDSSHNKLLLVRDSAGIKPLYYAHTKEGLAFASEVKAFADVPWLQEPNHQWPVYLMAYGFLPEPVTTLRQVQPLEKGTCAIYNFADNSLQKKVFRRQKFSSTITDTATAIQMVKQQFTAAVQRHMIADAPIGVFLSGGLDSSLIAKTAAGFTSRLNTVSLFFKEEQYSEKKYQDIVRQQIEAAHYQHLLTSNEFNNCLPDIINAMDLPCGDGINTWFISKYARQTGLKAVLSGIGSDEIFGGYPSFSRMAATNLLQQLPASILKMGRLFAAKKFKRLAYLGLGGINGRYLFLRGQFTPEDIAARLQLSPEEVWRTLQEIQFPDISHLSNGDQACWMEMNIYMQNQLLRDADVMSMAHGLEIRVPFLDSSFTDTVLSIAPGIKFGGSVKKGLLVEAFKEVLPSEVWNRPKMGFSFPFKEWFSNPMYASFAGIDDLRQPHAALCNGQLHWSQFFSLMLVKYKYGS
ncbi:MAG TPA: asparagine synthase (glutamine-hydrolyzing) [Ferruginibacter sp.]|nr:asparagine synthase (glutamine-hydrolyzing) [Ferruginibacter sp.]HMP21269.1 asparagine synthase (glutamine-hydrolyzing) [Ferruginibacter sp.]